MKFIPYSMILNDSQIYLFYPFRIFIWIYIQAYVKYYYWNRNPGHILPVWLASSELDAGHDEVPEKFMPFWIGLNQNTKLNTNHEQAI